MTTFSERLAAKKAAELAAQGEQNVHNEAVRSESNANVAAVAEGVSSNVQIAVQETTQPPVQSAASIIVQQVKQKRKHTQAEAEEKAKLLVPATDSSGKPLSGFAINIARKKKIAELLNEDVEVEDNGLDENAGTGAGTGTDTVSEQPIAQPATSILPASEGNGIATEERAEEDEEESEAYAAATPEARQAYADIKSRLDALQGMMGEDIKNNMQELKKSLHQNPNAVALMLPSDIGQMVTALRKMTGVELEKDKEKAAAKGTRAKKPKEIALNAEQLQAAWEEL